jgi:hypothetical protein
MALKTFVARKGLESGGGVYFKSREIAGSEQLTSEDFFIDCLYTGAALTVALPQINNTGEQRQIIVLRNSTEDTVNLVTVTGYSGGPINASTPFIYLKNGQTISFQVNYDYSGWLMTADYSFIQEDVAVGSTYRILNNNSATGAYSTVSGGLNNTAGDTAASTGLGSTVSGGINNIAPGDFSTVSGGSHNIISSIDAGETYSSVISGGGDNLVESYFATVSGGGYNRITDKTSAFSTISGGTGNFIDSAVGSVISGGEEHSIRSSYSSISGGKSNEIGPANSTHSTISGGSNNTIEAGVISGTISGGELNLLGSSSVGSTISGGSTNTVRAAGSTISGGTGNTIFSAGTGDVISGGSLNRSGQLGSYNIIAGGTDNSAGGSYTFIGGGKTNSATGSHNVIVGGQSNSIRNGLNITNSGILGGSANTVDHNDSFIIGSSIVTKRASTTHVNSIDIGNNLSYTETPGSANSSGEVVYFGTTTAGVGMTAGFVYEYGGTGTWGIARADSTANASGLLAIALGSSPSSGMLLRGFARYTAVSPYIAMGTTGGVVYLSMTANQFTQTAPNGVGQIVRIIGYCVNPTTDLLYFCPDTTWITRTS